MRTRSAEDHHAPMIMHTTRQNPVTPGTPAATHLENTQESAGGERCVGDWRAGYSNQACSTNVILGNVSRTQFAALSSVETSIKRGERREERRWRFTDTWYKTGREGGGRE